MAKLLEYPEPVFQRSGCKVGWLYYKTKKEADIASKIAEKKAKDMAERGYDFGFQVPGSERYCDPDSGAANAGLWEVVIP